VPWVAAHGLDVPLLFHELFANRISWRTDRSGHKRRKHVSKAYMPVHDHERARSAAHRVNCSERLYDDPALIPLAGAWSRGPLIW
jgi:hypothetical protein